MDKTLFQTRLAHLLDEIKGAHLVAVTKYSSIDDMLVAYAAGVYHLGENKVQDLMAKSLYFENHHLENIRWHFIGNLQSNKIKDLLKVPHLEAIHSVDSLKILQEIYKREQDFQGERLKIFLQIKTSDEKEKSGFENKTELKEAIDLMLSKKDSKIVLHGLMTMGSIRSSNFEEAAHSSFLQLKKMRDDLQNEYGGPSPLKLSMGMSQDYAIALIYGADYVRIGSALFGED